MAKPFDPRKTLKHIDNSLLREIFTQRGELDGVPWDELTEHKIEPVFVAMNELPEPQRLEIQVILRDINELADHRGLAVLAEEIRWRCPERIDEFKAMKGKEDKAMWMYLNVREAFDETTLFARADALQAGRHWKRRNGLPKGPLGVDQVMLDEISVALTSFYLPAQMRGRLCKVDHYLRHDGADYFFAYLDDYPDKHIVFDDNSDAPIIRSDRYAFENVFVFNSDDGSMEVFAPGGKKVWEPLQVLFCKAALHKDILPADPLRPTFKLDHLLTPNFPLPSDPNDLVDEARITRMRLAPRGSGGHIEIKADPKRHRNDIYRKIERYLKSENICIEGTRVTQATFSLRFIHDGPGRPPTMSFDVTTPNSCNLKSKPDEKRAVGERCLKLWGITDDEG